ncbi:MAG: hypothetical protein H6668_12325 [Ardenticatenaceae bacterium]|nr:hypothetical protein [Ardenticatenaceae bacterium]
MPPVPARQISDRSALDRLLCGKLDDVINGQICFQPNHLWQTTNSFLNRSQTNQLPTSGKPLFVWQIRPPSTASMIALVALSTDAMLPALSTIGLELGAQQANDNQSSSPSSFFFFFFSAWHWGSLSAVHFSDSTGHQPAMLTQLSHFMLGCLLAISPPFQVMLISRFAGMGVAGYSVTFWR